MIHGSPSAAVRLLKSANTWLLNQLLSGANNTAPNQVGVVPGSTSLMIRAQHDIRNGYLLVPGIRMPDYQTGGTTVSLLQGNLSTGSAFDTGMCAIPDATNLVFSVPLWWWAGGTVRVILYLTDRAVSASSSDVYLKAQPNIAKPTTNSTTQNLVQGTTVAAACTIAYTGTARYYRVELNVDFSTCSGHDATDPLQVKTVRFYRNGTDALDTSTQTIYLAAVQFIQT